MVFHNARRKMLLLQYMQSLVTSMAFQRYNSNRRLGNQQSKGRRNIQTTITPKCHNHRTIVHHQKKVGMQHMPNSTKPKKWRNGCYFWEQIQCGWVYFVTQIWLLIFELQKWIISSNGGGELCTNQKVQSQCHNQYFSLSEKEEKLFIAYDSLTEKSSMVYL
jgi:hypothetical protein